MGGEWVGGDWVKLTANAWGYKDIARMILAALHGGFNGRPFVPLPHSNRGAHHA